MLFLFFFLFSSYRPRRPFFFLLCYLGQVVGVLLFSSSATLLILVLFLSHGDKPAVNGFYLSSLVALFFFFHVVSCLLSCRRVSPWPSSFSCPYKLVRERASSSLLIRFFFTSLPSVTHTRPFSVHGALMSQKKFDLLCLSSLSSRLSLSCLFRAQTGLARIKRTCLSTAGLSGE